MAAVVCLRAQASVCARKITISCIIRLLCVFSARFAFCFKFYVRLNHVHFLAAILLRFYVLALVGVAPFCSRFPPLNLLLRHWIYNALLILLLLCVFSASCFF